jgi:hypothetical protein
MNFIRTNQTLRISDLIAPAMLPFNVLDGTTFPPADEPISAQSQTHQVEEGGPVRPAERVPYSSSHYLVRDRTNQIEEGGPVRPAENVPYSSSKYLVRDRSASSVASVCSGTTDTTPEVAAA